MVIHENEVKNLTTKALRTLLEAILDRLYELQDDDFFGKGKTWNEYVYPIIIGSHEVRDMSRADLKTHLKAILSVLDDLDDQDFFGSEGWRHFFSLED